MNLGDCFPGPTPVELAGSVYLAWELKIRHLAALDRWVCGQQPAPAVVPSDGPAEVRAQLKAAYDAACEGPKGVGTALGDTILFGTIEGRAEFLRVVLRRERPGEEALEGLA